MPPAPSEKENEPAETPTENEESEKALSQASAHPIDTINNAFEEILVTLQSNSDEEADETNKSESSDTSDHEAAN